MKKMLVVAMVVAAVALSGCTWLHTEEAKIVTEVKSIDWSAAATYWQKFVAGVNEYAPVAMAIFKNDDTTFGKIVTGVNDANAVVSDFSTTAASYQAGTIDEATVIAAAKDVETKVMDVAGLMAKAKAKAATSTVNPTVSK
jgi:hypothetical protein